MNRYPVWKYAIIVIALLLGVIYTLPNFFGEAPAVQVSSSKVTFKVDTATLGKVEDALKAAGVQATLISLEGTSIRARFETTDAQLKAKDIIQKALVPDAADPAYVVALNLISRSPNWLTALHSAPMYLGLEEVAQKLKKKLVLIQCGWFANEFIEKAFRDGAARFAPSVRHIFLDGRKEDVRKIAWGACDIFISLSDNIQETFGLTLIEAMAAGKPVIATDWDGYRQTARHGETGFMVPTFMPEHFGEDLALSHAAGSITYDQYLAQASTHVCLDLRVLRDAIEQLVLMPDLRRRMGLAGQKRAQSLFNWSVILRSYQQFWAELLERRMQAVHGMAPRPATQLNPGQLFATYPAEQLNASSRFVARGNGGTWQEIAKHPLFGAASVNAELMIAILQNLNDRPVSVHALADQLGQSEFGQVIEAISQLSKMGLVERV